MYSEKLAKLQTGTGWLGWNSVGEVMNSPKNWYHARSGCCQSWLLYVGRKHFSGTCESVSHDDEDWREKGVLIKYKDSGQKKVIFSCCL